MGKVMPTMMLKNFIKNFIKEDNGVTAIEYGLIAALIAVVIIGTLTTIGTKLKTDFLSIANKL